MSGSHACPGCWSTSILDNRVVCHQCWLALTRQERKALGRRLAGTIVEYLEAEQALAAMRTRRRVA